MSAFFTRAKHTTCGALISLESGSIGGSIVLSDHRKALPAIIYTTTERMPQRAHATATDRVRALRHALFSVILALEQDGMKALYTRQKHARIDRLLVSCGAPWSHTVTQMIHFTQEKPFTVTPQLVESIILDAYREETAHVPERERILAESGKDIVEKIIVDVALNGYHIAHPYGKQASEIDIAHLRGLVATPVLTALADAGKHIRNTLDMRVHTSSLISYCVLRDLYPHTDDALMVTMSEETTELALMQNGILYESVAAEYGADTLIRDIADTGKTIPEDIRGQLRAYTQKILTARQEKALAGAHAQYVRALRPALAALSVRYALPRTVFFITDESMEAFCTEVITDALRQGGGVTEKELIPLTPGRVRGLAEVPADTAPSVRQVFAARFFHKLHACGDTDINSPVPHS